MCLFCCCVHSTGLEISQNEFVWRFAGFRRLHEPITAYDTHCKSGTQFWGTALCQPSLQEAPNASKIYRKRRHTIVHRPSKSKSCSLCCLMRFQPCFQYSIFLRTRIVHSSVSDLQSQLWISITCCVLHRIPITLNCFALCCLLVNCCSRFSTYCIA